MRFKVTVEYDYYVDEKTAADDYGTTDPVEMAAIDHENLTRGGMLVDDLATCAYTVTVTPL